jgi:hypothetical protein
MMAVISVRKSEIVCAMGNKERSRAEKAASKFLFLAGRYPQSCENSPEGNDAESF